MFLPRPTKETKKRKMLRLPPLPLQHCHPQQVQLQRLKILFLHLHLHPKLFAHHYPKMSSGRCTNGCWRRSGRSNHGMPLRRKKSTRRKLFLRSSFEHSLYLVCDDCIGCPAGLEYFFFSTCSPVRTSSETRLVRWHRW